MRQRALMHLARLLWPHIRPYVLDLLTAHEAQIAELISSRIAAQAEHAANGYIAASERLRRKYVGES